MSKLLLAAGALAALLSTGFAAIPGATAHAANTSAVVARPRPDCDGDNRYSYRCLHNKTYLAGRLVLEPSDTAPTYLRVRLDNGPTITVMVGTGTTILRRYDGVADLSQLSLGDLLQIKGVFEAGNVRVFDATTVEDVSIQEAFTSARIALTAFSLSALSGKGIVLRDVKNAPYYNGETLTLQFQPTTTVTRRDGSPGTLDDLAALRLGQHISVSGRYDRHSRTLTVLHAHI